MAQSALNAANLALRLLGDGPLTSLSDATKQGEACNANIDDCKRTLLRMHPWKFAVKRKKIQPYQDFAISNVTFVSSELIEVTHASTTFVAGNYVTVSGVMGATGANGTWEVASVVNPTTVRLTAIGVTTSTILGTYVTGSDYIRRSPAFDYAYLYQLPSDCLRLLDINNTSSNPRWRVEGAFILSDSNVLNIQYVFDVSDYATMDPAFYQCLSHYLAYNLCDHISASDGKKNELHVYLYGGQGKRGILQQARFIDASENSLDQIEANDWVDSRISSLPERG